MYSKVFKEEKRKKLSKVIKLVECSQNSQTYLKINPLYVFAKLKPKVYNKI